MSNEQNTLLRTLFNQLMNVPHKNIGPMVRTFNAALAENPVFVSRVLTHIFRHSQINDQRAAAVISLFQSNPQFGLRQSAQAMLGLSWYETGNTEGMNELEPFRIFDIWDYLNGTETVTEDVSYRDKKTKQAKTGKKIIKQKRTDKAPNPYHILRSTMTDYLNFLVAHPGRFEGVLLHNAPEVKRVVKTYRLSLPEPFKSILDGKPPEGSVFWQIKQVARMRDVDEKARAVLEMNLPFRIAVNLLPKNNAGAMIALIGVMTPTEAVNNIARVEASGILSIPEVAKAFANKVAQARNVASMTGRKSSQAQTEAIKQAVSLAQDAAVKQGRQIEKNTGVIVDISVSMDEAIDAAIEFLSRISAICQPDRLRVVMANEYAHPVTLTDLSLSSIRKAFAGVKPFGNTSMGVGLKSLLDRADFEMEQVVVITDGFENTNPAYSEQLKRNPDLYSVIIGIPSGTPRRFNTNFTNALTNLGFRHDLFVYEGDYYILDQIPMLLGGPHMKSLVEQIIETSLPTVLGKK